MSLGLDVLREVAAPVGLAAVDVGEAVFLCQAPGAVDAAGFLRDVGIGGKGGDGAADVVGGLGGDEVGVLLGALLPVGLCDAKVIEHGLGAEEAGRDGEGGYVVGAELLGHGVG